MLTYASRHRVQVAVFNDSLLALGATISTTSVDADMAETIVSVASQLIDRGRHLRAAPDAAQATSRFEPAGRVPSNWPVMRAKTKRVRILRTWISSVLSHSKLRDDLKRLVSFGGQRVLIHEIMSLQILITGDYRSARDRRPVLGRPMGSAKKLQPLGDAVDR